MPNWPTIKLKSDFNILRYKTENKHNFFYYSTNILVLKMVYVGVNRCKICKNAEKDIKGENKDRLSCGVLCANLSKISFILTKKFGKANVRNLARRRLRHLIFSGPLLKPQGFLASIFVKPGAKLSKTHKDYSKQVYSFSSLQTSLNIILPKVLRWQLGFLNPIPVG